jgi:hypothetical protein
MKITNLFNLTAELQELYTAFTAEADEHGEVPPDTAAMITAQLEAKETDLAVKLDNYIDLIRRLEGEAKIAEEEKVRYARMVSSRLNAVEQLKANLKLHLEAIEATKVITAKQRRVWLQSNGTAPLILDDGVTEETLPEKFVRVVRSIDRVAIGHAIKSGAELPFARYGEKGTHIRIS